MCGVRWACGQVLRLGEPVTAPAALREWAGRLAEDAEAAGRYGGRGAGFDAREAGELAALLEASAELLESRAGATPCPTCGK